jgi:hypothetical protein
VKHFLFIIKPTKKIDTGMGRVQYIKDDEREDPSELCIRGSELFLSENNRHNCNFTKEKKKKYGFIREAQI